MKIMAEPGHFGAPVMPPVPTGGFATIQEARASGVNPGDAVTAVLAPATGGFNARPESLVATTVKAFWQSPTIKAARRIILSAIGAVVLVVGNAFINVWSVGKSLTDAGAIDWRATERTAEIAAGTILVAAVMAWFRVHDNNVVASGPRTRTEPPNLPEPKT